MGVYWDYIINKDTGTPKRFKFYYYTCLFKKMQVIMLGLGRSIFLRHVVVLHQATSVLAKLHQGILECRCRYLPSMMLGIEVVFLGGCKAS